MGSGLVNTASMVESGWHYQLVIRPDGQVCNLLAAEKHEFSLKYITSEAVAAKPNVTILHFTAQEHLEDTIIKWIHRICSMHKGFPVILNNYGGVPDDNIHIRIQNPDAIRELTAKLQVIDDFITSNNCPPVTIVHRPYLLLASGLTHDVFERAMPHYSGKLCHEIFVVNELLLLKRKHTFDSCRHVNVFRLYPADSNAYNQVA